MIPFISTIPLIELASGDRLSLQSYQFQGMHAGKKVYLQANLHGAEIAGNTVLHELMTWLRAVKPEQLAGEIWLVPVCNPLGVNQRAHHFSSGRFNPYDGVDWNRIFWDYEQTGADILAFAQAHLNTEPQTIQQIYRQQILSRFNRLAEKLQMASGVPFREKYRFLLQSLCLDADSVIDLHTNANEGLDYLYYFRDRSTSAQHFGFDYGIELDEYDGDAFDEAFIKPWLALEASFAQLQRPLRFEVEAFTLELGSAMQPTARSIALGLRGIQNYLIQKGFLDVAPIATPAVPTAMQVYRRSQMTRYYAPAGGMICDRLPLGSRVEAGQVLYRILSFRKNGELPTQTEVRAERAGLILDVSINQAVNEGEYVLHLL